ncbi:arylesterase [Moritella viscosa]|uniref:arylesterase n=1 Tax=Moritella viscosa TaxID=80854 RepID=UPI00091D075A|nr:arylesterase [Moritella viscosa]SGZ07235.1 Acyl-CoA thioesterase I [Moritella viscosa]SGZ08313.1 Acyl-CoA thioesterase I [Moritella viscosa]
MFKNAFKVLLLIVILLPAAYATANHKILLLGDSLSASYGMTQSEGWVTLLNQQLVKQNAPYNIINASISGETTAGGLSRLPGILAKQSIDALIIELGGNDGLRGFSPKLIKKNLTKMVELAHAQNIPVYLMNIRIPPNYGPRYSKMFTDVFTQVGSEKDITVLPFFMEQIAIDPSLMQNDGIHPNRTAQPKIADIMSKQLAVIYSEHN